MDSSHQPLHCPCAQAAINRCSQGRLRCTMPTRTHMAHRALFHPGPSFQTCMLVTRCCILAGVPVIAALAALTRLVTLAVFWQQVVQEKRHRQSRCLGSRSGTLSCTCRPGSQQMRRIRSACGWMAGHMSSCRCELCQCICTPATYALIAASL